MLQHAIETLFHGIRHRQEQPASRLGNAAISRWEPRVPTDRYRVSDGRYGDRKLSSVGLDSPDIRSTNVAINLLSIIRRAYMRAISRGSKRVQTSASALAWHV